MDTAVGAGDPAGSLGETIRAKDKGKSGGKPRSGFGGEILRFGAVDERCCVIDTALLPKLRFTSKLDNCVAFSLLNVTGSSNRQARNLLHKLNTPLCGLPELAAVSHVIGFHLKRHEDKTLSWIVEQKQGRWLLMQQVHCIAIDSNKGHIFDSSRDNVLPLSLENLHLCGFTDGDIEIREVVHYPNFR